MAGARGAGGRAERAAGGQAAAGRIRGRKGAGGQAGQQLENTIKSSRGTAMGARPWAHPLLSCCPLQARKS